MRVVITGASRGIGRATALKLAADGAEALTTAATWPISTNSSRSPANLRTAGCKVRTLQGRYGPAQRARQTCGRGREGDGRHRCHRRQRRHHRARQAGRSRYRDLGPHLRRQPPGQLAFSQGGASASQAIAAAAVVMLASMAGHHAADPDRRLQPGQGRPRHADGNAGDGMGARRHPRQFRLPGLRAHLDDRRDLPPVQAGARAAPGWCRSAGSPSRATSPTRSPSC